MGGSVTRYQYMDLVYRIHFGNFAWNSALHKRMVDENLWSSWNDFYNGTTAPFEGSMKCDCFREDVPPNTIWKMTAMQNRYFRQEHLLRLALTYMHPMFQGHCSGADFDSADGYITSASLFARGGVGICNYAAQRHFDVWKLYPQFKLQPKPGVIVFNVGYVPWTRKGSSAVGTDHSCGPCGWGSLGVERNFLCGRSWRP